MILNDIFYDYTTFSEDRLEEIFKGWDGLSGYHGLLIKKCASLLIGKTVLDVGCGLCHLYEELKKIGYMKSYTGIDNHSFILKMTKERYPSLNLTSADVYNLSQFDVFDTIFAIGLYREQPKKRDGIEEMIKHSNKCVVMTYFAVEKGKVPEVLECYYPEIINHNIDDRLEIVRLWTV